MGLKCGLTFYSAFFEYFRFSFRLLGLEEHFIPSLSIFYRVVQKLGRFECGDLFIWSRCLKNRKISKNLKKSQKIFKICWSQKCQKSRLSDPMGVCKHLGGQWGPLDAILKLFRKNIFFRFSGILAGCVGLLIFDFGPADHHKVPGRCPTHYFSSSQTYREHLGTLVCHPRSLIRSV